MACIARDLLEAADALLDTETQPGGTLEDIDTYFVLFSSSDSPPENAFEPPVLKVDLLPIPAERITCCTAWLDRTYLMRFQLWTENEGDTSEDEAAELIDLVEDVFINNNLGLSNNVLAPQKDYAIPSAPPFDAPVNGGASLIITHKHIDVRSV